MYLLHELFEQRHIAIMGRDRAVIADVIAKVSLRTFGERGNPDGFVSEVLDVVQFFNNAGYISDTVAIAIEKGAWIDMINSGFFPPFGVLGKENQNYQLAYLHIR